MVLEAIFCAFGAVFFIFAGCELGERNAGQFDRIYNELIQFDWYRFSIKIQRMLPIIAIYAQEPVVIEFFGSAACTRECFRKVYIKTHI